MEIYDYIVEKEESGIRIDRYLAEKDSGLSRSFLQKLLKEGQITVGEKAAKSNYKVRENDRIHLEIPDSSEPDIVPEDIPLDILYEDEDVLIVNKPKGWLYILQLGIIREHWSMQLWHIVVTAFPVLTE